jgi:alkaline phosphatase D
MFGLLLLAGCGATAEPSGVVSERSGALARVTHGVAAGEVTATSALIWGRCDRLTELNVEWRAAASPWQMAPPVRVMAEHDYTATVRLDALVPGSEYEYRVRCAGAADGGEPVDGRFRTAPSPTTAAPVRFAWSGDVGGQNVCRDQNQGYPIFRTIESLHADFFIALGDMIYADNPCRPVGRYGNAQIVGPPTAAVDLTGFWAYWKYNREDELLRSLLASAATYAVWDDHEVRDDFGPADDSDAAGHHLMPAGLQAFRDYNALPAGPMFRSVRWGKHLEVFFLDTRSYRDANTAADDPRHPKTLLGREQREWLKQGVAGSTATWKVIVSSVPLAIPTSLATAHDGWANGDGNSGFENELFDILRFLKKHHVRNELWISTDVHFVSVFRHTPFSDSPDFKLYEVETGPLNSGIVPKPGVDPSLHPQRLFVHPTDATAEASFEQALGWFNFGMVTIDGDGGLNLDIRDARGRDLFNLILAPQ